MKQKKLFSLGITFLLGLSQLSAQKQIPPPILKSGDWFEAGIRITNVARTLDNKFEVRYELSDKPENGNLVFKVSIERMRLKYTDEKNNRLGYDSYYPPYIENRRRPLTKQTYELTTDGHGKIAKLQVLSPAHKINFSLISIKAQSNDKAERWSDKALPIVHLKRISEDIISKVISGKPLPKTVDLPNPTDGNDIARAVLKSGSFKLPTNAVIKGNITNLKTADSVYAVNNEIFMFNKAGSFFSNDGSFSANVLAGFNERRRWIFGQFDEYKTFSVLLAPYDTLIVKADALDFDNTLSFSGNAATKAYLSLEEEAAYASQWVNQNNYRTKSLEEFLAFQKKGQDDFDGIMRKYSGRVSSEILDYCRAVFKYVQVGARLEFLSHNRQERKPQIALDEFPKGFFERIDTLPVAMSGLEGNMYYSYYLTWLLSYQKTKLGMVNAVKYGFHADYATAVASFEGYPLHYSIYESLKKELHKSEVGSTERLKNYYEDFMNNCGDTAFTNRLQNVWAQAQRWLPGSPSPVKALMLLDGSKLDLSKFKGKPLVLIVNNDDPEVLKAYIELIKKQNGKQVHFVIGQATSQWNIDQSLSDLKNVTYVKLFEGHDKQKNFDLYYRQTKVFTFDSDFRVISSYLFDSAPDEYQVIEEMIEKAIESEVMTKEQKAELIKTIGWSAGSILFVGLIFFWIYKTRLANFKRKESLNRKIMDLEVKAIRSQMNPHFMFNALNSIQSLINSQQYKSANIYLEKFSVLMRRVLNNSEKSFVTLSDELDAIILYCELEQLRFNFKFEIQIAGKP